MLLSYSSPKAVLIIVLLFISKDWDQGRNHPEGLGFELTMACCLRFEPEVWGRCLVLPSILTYWERHSPLCTFVSTPEKGQGDASCLTSMLWGSKQIRHMKAPCIIHNVRITKGDTNLGQLKIDVRLS